MFSEGFEGLFMHQCTTKQKLLLGGIKDPIATLENDKTWGSQCSMKTKLNIH